MGTLLSLLQRLLSTPSTETTSDEVAGTLAALDMLIKDRPAQPKPPKTNAKGQAACRPLST